jgi:hypothetical protein
MTSRNKSRRKRHAYQANETGDGTRLSLGRIALGAAVTVITGVLVGLILHETLKQRDSGPPLKVNAVISSPPAPKRVVKVAAVNTERAAAIQGYTWVFARPLDLNSESLKELNTIYAGMPAELATGGETAFEHWVKQRGGVAPEYQITRVVLEGNRLHDVEILDAHVRAHCTTPLHGSILASPPAAMETTARIGFDLDSPDPIAQVAVGGAIQAEPFFATRTLSVARGEQQVLDIITKTQRHYCRYVVVLDVLDGSHRSALVIDDHGADFQVSAQTPGRPKAPYAGYQAVYLGGVLSPTMNDRFVFVSPLYNPEAQYETPGAN